MLPSREASFQAKAGSSRAMKLSKLEGSAVAGALATAVVAWSFWGAGDCKPLAEVLALGSSAGSKAGAQPAVAAALAVRATRASREYVLERGTFSPFC